MIDFLFVIGFLSFPFVLYFLKQARQRANKTLQTQANARVDLAITLDRKSAEYRGGETLTATLSATPREPVGAAVLRVGAGFTFGEGVKPDRMIQDRTIDVPAMRQGENFTTTVSFELPNGPLSYEGYNTSVSWRVYAEFDQLLHRWDAETHIKFSVSPGAVTAMPAPSKPIAKIALKPEMEGAFVYQRDKGPLADAFHAFCVAVIALGFSAMALGVAGFLVVELIGHASGPELVSDGSGATFEAEVWQPQLHPVVRWLMIGVGALFMSIGAFIPALFGAKAWTVFWQQHLRVLLLKRRLGAIELSESDSIALGSPWRMELRLCPSQTMEIEHLRLELCQEEMLLISRADTKFRLSTHPINEWTLIKKGPLTLAKGQAVTFPMECTIPANLPGSWVAATTTGDFEVRHRWVISTNIKPVGEAPLMQVWLLDLKPTQAYEAKVCEPSQHY